MGSHAPTASVKGGARTSLGRVGRLGTVDREVTGRALARPPASRSVVRKVRAAVRTPGDPQPGVARRPTSRDVALSGPVVRAPARCQGPACQFARIRLAAHAGR